eukprot:Hpha_TRINITY_DN15810_c2_g1::TRINITY_DN15810_c2_g1_i1::g.191339::m.191339
MSTPEEQELSVEGGEEEVREEDMGGGEEEDVTGEQEEEAGDAAEGSEGEERNVGSTTSPVDDHCDAEEEEGVVESRPEGEHEEESEAQPAAFDPGQRGASHEPSSSRASVQRAPSYEGTPPPRSFASPTRAETESIRFGRATPEDEAVESTELDLAGLSVAERLYYVGCGMLRSREERIHAAREHRALREMSELTFSPQITAKAKRQQASFSERAKQWDEQRAARERERQAKAEVELEGVEQQAGQARICQKSRAITNASYSGPVAGWDRRCQHWVATRRPIPERAERTPRITAAASSRREALPVGDRLYAEAGRQWERLRERREIAELRELVDPETAQPYFAPNARPADTRPRHADAAVRVADQWAVGDPVPRRRQPDELVNSLLSKGQAAMIKREKLAVQLHTAAHTFAPRLTKKSAQLVAQRQSPRRPLHERPPAKKPVSPPSPPSPSAAQRHPRRRGSGVGDEDVFSRMRRLDKRRDLRLAELRQKEAEREQKNCTFSPSIHDGPCSPGADAPPRFVSCSESRAHSQVRVASQPVIREERDTGHARQRGAPLDTPTAHGSPPSRSRELESSRISPKRSQRGGAAPPTPQEVEQYLAAFESETRQALDTWQKAASGRCRGAAR